MMIGSRYRYRLKKLTCCRGVRCEGVNLLAFRIDCC